MGAPDLLDRLRAVGVRLWVEGDSLIAEPRTALTDDLRAAIRQHKPAIFAELQRSAETFGFFAPADPESDREALEERAGILGEANGCEQATALAEARWQAEKEKTWRVFIGNARRILDAPEAARKGFLDRYHAEAARRYGELTARHMARTMQSWVAARAAEGGLTCPIAQTKTRA